MVQTLYEFMDEIEYGKTHIQGLIGSGARATHNFVLEDLVTTIDHHNEDCYWVYEGIRNRGCPIVFKTSTVKGSRNTSAIDIYIKQHLISSVIRNILLDRSTSSVRERCNAAVFIYYYNIFYHTNREYTIEEITESVVIYLSDTIKVMIDKELTTYRDCPNMSNIIEEMQMRLNLERTQSVVKKRWINLRS